MSDLLPPDRLPPRVCPLPGAPLELTDSQRRQLSRPSRALELSSGNGLRRVRWIPSEPHLLERMQHRAEGLVGGGVADADGGHGGLLASMASSLSAGA